MIKNTMHSREPTAGKTWLAQVHYKLLKVIFEISAYPNVY
jgi:hypothetical protein